MSCSWSLRLFSVFAVARDACLIGGWALDCSLMLPRSESLGHAGALNRISQSSASQYSYAVPMRLTSGHGDHMSQLYICELLHAGGRSAETGLVLVTLHALSLSSVPSAQKRGASWCGLMSGWGPPGAEFGVWCTEIGVPVTYMLGSRI